MPLLQQCSHKAGLMASYYTLDKFSKVDLHPQLVLDTDQLVLLFIIQGF